MSICVIRRIFPAQPWNATMQERLLLAELGRNDRVDNNGITKQEA